MASAKRPRSNPKLGPIFDGLGLDAVQICLVTGLGPNTVAAWRCGRRGVTRDTALLLERELGVPRHATRPDLWAEPSAASKARAA